MPVSYPFDTTGLALTNLIVDEIHTLTEVNDQNYRILIPEFAPFYLDNLQIKHTDLSGQTHILTEGPDYTICLPYIGATRSIGKMLYGGITINRDDINGLIKVTYQTLGGDWTADRLMVLEALAEYVYNPRITVWDIVTNKPNQFPPINHDQSMNYIYGHQDLIDSINDLADQVAQGPNPSTGIVLHLIDENNPHQVTKEQVGLGLVANLPLATDEEVDLLAPVDKYMTLRQMLLLGILGQDPNLLGDHTGNLSNPHQVNKMQVGLGLVENLALATETEVTNGEHVTKYVTLSQVLSLIDNMAPVVLQGADISRAELLFCSVSTHRRV